MLLQPRGRQVPVPHEPLVREILCPPAQMAALPKGTLRSLGGCGPGVLPSSLGHGRWGRLPWPFVFCSHAAFICGPPHSGRATPVLPYRHPTSCDHASTPMPGPSHRKSPSVSRSGRDSAMSSSSRRHRSPFLFQFILGFRHLNNC